jgi:uncharacterized repeat protein (TIGR03803 family)
MLLTALEARMKKKTICTVIAILGYSFAVGQAQENVLYSFGGVPNDGAQPVGSLAADSSGNLYGMTQNGGAYDGGTVFELTKNNDGSWSEATLYSFCQVYSACPDGSAPVGSPVVDVAGNVYGTTYEGGSISPACSSFTGPYGCGVAFELSPPALPGGTWSYSLIYNFCSVGQYCEDGYTPTGPLTFDKFGNLYGTTAGGGQNQSLAVAGGVVFELSPGPNGWAESIAYSFCSVGAPNCSDGYAPVNGVTFDSSGNIYGTTSGGGNPNTYLGGVVYKLSPGSTGWTEMVLYVFPPPPGIDGTSLPGPVSIDRVGNLYLTRSTLQYRTGHGDSYSNGAVARLTVNGGVNIFRFNGTDGLAPLSGVIIDPTRHLLYGTTGSQDNRFAGNVFQINPLGKEANVYSFCPQQPACADGEYPSGGLLEDASGHLFGTTYYGGAYGPGVVYEITP